MNVTNIKVYSDDVAFRIYTKFNFCTCLYAWEFHV